MPRLVTWLVMGTALALLTGCPDNRRDVTGPGIIIHCASQSPLGNGDTTVRTTCPDNIPQ